MFLGNGESMWAEGFRDRFAPNQRVLSDPKRNAYRATKMAKGAKTTANFGAVKAGIRATAKGFVQGIMRGTANQQGGVLVVTPDNEIVYAYRSAFAGDHPPVAEAIAALP